MNHPRPHCDSRWRQAFRRRLRRWYRRAARDLPWRRTRDPYAVWVSEIMLQQTQVATVIPYFGRFLDAFPTVAALAAADEQQVLRLWEGLGYYRRARQMHAAARKVVDEHDGHFPQDSASLLALPGIGRYTAGAILSFALDRQFPIVEANTVRLYSRLLGMRDDPGKSSGQARLWEFAAELLPRTAPGDFNQALIDLGSTVCTPREPDCDACPVATLCAARRENAVDQIPAGVRKVVFEQIVEAAVVIRSPRGLLIRQCQPDERWSGLWDFPRVPVPELEYDTDIICEAVQRQVGVSVALGARFHQLKHGVTRFRITLLCFHASLSPRRQGDLAAPSVRWVDVAHLSQYPLSVTGRKIANYLLRHGMDAPPQGVLFDRHAPSH